MNLPQVHMWDSPGKNIHWEKVSSASYVGKAGRKSMVTTHPLALQESKLKVA